MYICSYFYNYHNPLHALRSYKNIILLLISLKFSGLGWAFCGGHSNVKIKVHEALDLLGNVYKCSHFQDHSGCWQNPFCYHGFHMISMGTPCAWLCPKKRKSVESHCLLKISTVVLYCLFSWKDYWVFYRSKVFVSWAELRNHSQLWIKCKSET